MIGEVKWRKTPAQPQYVLMLLCIEGLFLELMGGRAAGCMQSMIVVPGLGSNENRETFQVAQKMTLSMCSLDHPCVD